MSMIYQFRMNKRKVDKIGGGVTEAERKNAGGTLFYFIERFFIVG